jgi:alkanesulfonate monooxygenase SsuD/methylene tetrahydromethanopterin reductase-like flavin-dependent oxidoreductase (luciferase family)
VNVFDDIQFYLFNHHHYIDIPPDQQRYGSTWVDLPNALFDPERGHRLYQRYTRELLLAEQLGFDAIALNEHHNTTYSMQPAVGIRAAYVAALTKRVKLLVAGTPINLSWPSRVAEEYAMLDVLSGGRMEYGFPLGTGMEYWSNATAINPTTARARFREALDIVLRAWEQDGPTRHDGDFYTYRYLNTWPKPMQKPRPMCYIVGSGSAETVDLAVRTGCGYSIVFTPIANQLRAFENFRRLAEERGRTVRPDELIFTVIAYVGDTDDEAVRECRPHIQRFFEWFHRVPPKYLSPPGYVSRDEYLRRAASAALADASRATWDDMVSVGRIAAGSPDTVADLIAGWAQEAGTSRILVTLQHGDMPEWKAVKNMTRFAEEVIPRIRARASMVDEVVRA